MIENIERFVLGLENLTLEELSRGAERSASRERRCTAALIAHLAEISRRKGHLELVVPESLRVLPEGPSAE